MLKLDRLVLATRNAGKVAELRHALRDWPIKFFMASDFLEVPEVDEDQPTLAGNAEKKAMALYQHTGLPTLADDTGLEVDALNGAPGIYAARYAGPDCTPADNRKKMLVELKGIENRKARFRTVIAFIENETTRFFEGVCEGNILDYERGAGGFGYDAIFIPAGYDRTFAELTKDEKNRISHRGKAIQAFVSFLLGLTQLRQT